MKVQTVQPVRFTTGEILAPEDLNAILLYAKDALDDVASRRFAKTLLPLPLVEDCGTPYTQAMNVEELTYRFIPVATCIVERVFLHANMTCTGELQVNITDLAGNPPAGATTPWLSSKDAIDMTTGQLVDASTGIIASATDDVQILNVDRVLLVKDTEYKIIVSGTANFTISRGDLVLHLATDRWQPAGAILLPNFQPTLFSDATARDATLVNANTTSLTTEKNKLAANLRAPVPAIFVKHNFVTGTSVNIRKWRIPTIAAARGQMKTIRVDVFAFTAGALSITATLKDAAGVTKTTTTAVVAGTQKSTVGGAVSLDMTGGDASDPTKDWSLELSSNSATNCVKAYAHVWLSRA